MKAPVLRLDGFGVGFRERVVLAEVTFDVPARGVVAVMGQAGGGKSTLLRTLAGLNEAQPDLRQWGRATYRGSPLGDGNRPVLVQQGVHHVVSTVRENLVSSFPDRRALTRHEQNQRLTAMLAHTLPELQAHLDDEAVRLSAPLRRLLAALRAIATDAPLICLDETSAGLESPWAEQLMSLMRWYAQRHAVLFVTHHQRQARAVADVCVLLAGGRVQECAPCRAFFERPASSVTRQFLDNGSVGLPSPDADPRTLADDAPPQPPLPTAALSAASASVGPRGFHWLVPGRLGGLPRPGIVASLDEDLAGLRRLGVTLLVTLEETETVSPARLKAAGITSLHFPVRDMAAPEPEEAAAWCQRLAVALEAGEVVALHCRAGQGRTGTLLACQLIWSGASAIEALDRVRGVDPKWVTSDLQVQFLETFSHAVRWRLGAPSIE